MLKQLKKELTSMGVFNNTLPPIVSLLNGAIANSTIPTRMKTITAISELTTFSSQFRRNMWHWEGFELPVNSVSFIIAGSGIGKDSGVKAIRRSLEKAYNIIYVKRKELAKVTAIKKAEEAGCDDPTEKEVYEDFYCPPPPIYIAPTTPQGLIQHLNDIAECPIGAGSMYAGEIGDELASSGSIDEVIKTIAEVYDTGDKEVIYTKGVEYRSKEIKSMSLTALFAGSPNYLVYDEAVKKKFMIAFGSKLARRSFFCYVPKALPRKHYENITEMVKDEKQANVAASKIKEKISEKLVDVTKHQLIHVGKTLPIDNEVHHIFTMYKRFNADYADTIDPKYPLSKLVREHLQWKALKLSGALAIIKCNIKVGKEDFIEAMQLCEILDNDMRNFEVDLVKEPYEIFADSMKLAALDGKAKISLHGLKKAKYINSSGNTTNKIKELVNLAASYDKNAIYLFTEEGIEYEEIRPTDTINITYKEINNKGIYKCIENKGTKQQLDKAKGLVAITASKDLIVESTTFKGLRDLLKGDYAYSPFRFKDGVHLKTNLLPGTKWLVLDIDDSAITMEEAHFLLQDINHHMGQSSDKDNEFKFRVLLELDSVVDVSAIVWRYFFLAVAEELSLKADPLPQSQLFFAYSTSTVKSVTDAAPIAVRDHIMTANRKATESRTISRVYTTREQRAAMADPQVTFNYAYECLNDGSGSRKLLGAARKAFEEYNASKEEVINLIKDINDYWVSSMTEERLEKTFFSQIRRW